MISTTSDRAVTLDRLPGGGFDAEAALAAVRRAIGPRKDAAQVQLHEPLFVGREREYVLDAIDSTFVSSVGEYVNRFERDLARICGVGHAIATANGTAALHVALLLAGVKAGDEVLIPALTFVATANAVAYCGAVPHLCDVTERTLGLDPLKLDAHLARIAERSGEGCRNRETGRRIAAVMPMHTFGHPVELDELLDVCRRWGIALVEDAAEALGSTYKGSHVGGVGRVAGLSFNGNKIVTTGGGGAILTNDPGLAKLAKHLTTTAKIPHRWAFDHDMLGYNYRLPNLNAALGCAQLEQLPDFLAAKRTLAERYIGAFRGVRGATIFQDADFARSNYWLVIMLLDEPDLEARDRFMSLCHASDVLVRPAWSCMQRQAAYLDVPRMDLGVTEALEARIVSLPSSVILGRDDAS